MYIYIYSIIYSNRYVTGNHDLYTHNGLMGIMGKCGSDLQGHCAFPGPIPSPFSCKLLTILLALGWWRLQKHISHQKGQKTPEKNAIKLAHKCPSIYSQFSSDTLQLGRQVSSAPPPSGDAAGLWITAEPQRPNAVRSRTIGPDWSQRCHGRSLALSICMS